MILKNKNEQSRREEDLADSISTRVVSSILVQFFSQAVRMTWDQQRE
jgi:hypothetical protein